MRKVYTANSVIDAHIVKGLLEQHEIEAYVDGQFLQGGMGELPAIGLVSVRVRAQDEAAALRVVRQFEGADRDHIEVEVTDGMVDSAVG